MEQAQAEVEKWATEVQQKRDSVSDLALAEFINKHFDKAKDLFKQSAEETEQELKNSERKEAEQREQSEKLRAKLVNELRRAGDSSYNDYHFAEALESYEEALLKVKRESDAPLWAATIVDVGLANGQLGIRVEGRKATEYLAAAVGDFRKSLEVRTRQELPQDWAMTQNNLGNALSEQGIRTGGQQGTELLGQAVAAYRSALEVRTRQELPQQWATTQNNFANALWTLGKQLLGKERLQPLQESVAAFREIAAWEANDQSRFALANALGSLAFNLVLDRQFADAETSCKEALALVDKIGDGVQKVDRENLIFIEQNFAHALFFQGHYYEALTIYRKNWSKPLNGKTFGEITLEDFAAFDKAGLTHPDLSRMKEALAKLNSDRLSQ